MLNFLISRQLGQVQGDLYLFSLLTGQTNKLESDQKVDIVKARRATTGFGGGLIALLAVSAPSISEGRAKSISK